MDKLLDKYLGTIFGLAIGDALGAPLEFLSLERIKERFGPSGLKDLEHYASFPIGTYTDDTQMSVALAKALVASSRSDSLDDIMANVVKEFISWNKSPENNRAPGVTCCSGCRKLEKGVHWSRSGHESSKGCGAAMRSAPIGLFYFDDDERLYDLAYAASACTHGNITGIVAGIATAYLTKLALVEERPLSMYNMLVNFTKGKSDAFDEKMKQVSDVLSLAPDEAIPMLGEGWTGEEAVAVSLYCFLKHPDDYVKCVLTAVNTSGDSDSTGCIAGAISGAYNGYSSIPRKWVAKIENSGLLYQLGYCLLQARAK